MRVSRAGRVLLAVAAIGAANVVAVAPAQADLNRWVAIAYSSTTRYWGYEVGYTNDRVTRSHAVSYCMNKGAASCVVVVDGMNTCVSLANNFHGDFAVAQNRDIGNASVAARLKLFAGRTLITACSDGREQTR